MAVAAVACTPAGRHYPQYSQTPPENAPVAPGTMTLTALDLAVVTSVPPSSAARGRYSCKGRCEQNKRAAGCKAVLRQGS